MLKTLKELTIQKESGMYNLFGTFTWFMQYYYPGCIDYRKKLFIEDFYNLYIGRYGYKNIPDSLKKMTSDKPIWDMLIFFNGVCAWFKDPVLGVMCLPVSGGWKLNELGKPTEWFVHGLSNSYTRYLNESNSVLMFNDECNTIPFEHIAYNVDYILDLEKVSKQNINTQYQPFVFYTETGSSKNSDIKKSFIQAFKDFIYIRKKSGAKKIDKEDIGMEVFNTEVQFKGKEYMDMEKEYENRILTYLGYKNVNIEKRERLLTGEISANDLIIQDNYTNCLDSRKKHLEKVNEMFGTDIQIEERELKTLIAGLTSEYMGGANRGILSPKSNPEVQK